VHPLFGKADVFVFPSLEEGGPQVTYEAALHGLPIIASPMGASRLGDTEGTMLIVNPADTVALAAEMERLAASVPLRRELGSIARQKVFDFDWDAVGRERMMILSEIFGLAGAKEGPKIFAAGT